MGDRYLNDGTADAMRREADAWERVQRQLVIFNWILTAATAVAGAVVVYSAIG